MLNAVNLLLIWLVDCSDPLGKGMSISEPITPRVDLYNFTNVTEERKWIQVKFTSNAVVV